jgi:hypothetical protein
MDPKPCKQTLRAAEPAVFSFARYQVSAWARGGRMTARSMVAACICVSILGVAPAWAQHAGNQKKDEARPPDGTPAGASVAADPDGRLRPVEAEEMRQLLAGIAPFVSQSDAGLTPVFLANGAGAIDLQDRFQSVMLARTTTAGAVVGRCVTSGDEATAFLSQQANPQAAPPRPATPILEEK